MSTFELFPIALAPADLKAQLAADLHAKIAEEATKAFAGMPAEVKADIDKLTAVMTSLTIDRIMAGHDPNSLGDIVEKIFDDNDPTDASDTEALRASLRAATSQLEALAASA